MFPVPPSLRPAARSGTPRGPPTHHPFLSQAWPSLHPLTHQTWIHFSQLEPNADCFKRGLFRGAWVALSVKRPTSAQVRISRSVGSSPASGSVLTARSPEPVSDSVSLSLCPSPAHTLSLSKINKRKKKSSPFSVRPEQHRGEGREHRFSQLPSLIVPQENGPRGPW